MFEEIKETKRRSDDFNESEVLRPSEPTTNTACPLDGRQSTTREARKMKRRQRFSQREERNERHGTELGPEVEKQGSTLEQTTWPPLPRQRANKEKNERPRAN